MWHKKISYTKTASQVDLDNVVSVAEIKSFLRIEHNADDQLLSTIRLAAVAYVEEYTNTFVGKYECTGTTDVWRPLLFPVGPVSSVSSVKYRATNGGDLLTLPTTKYFVDLNATPARIRFLEPPTLADDELAPIQIVFIAGHTDSATPDSMRHAIFMLSATMYEQRVSEIVGTISSQSQFGVRALLAPHRIIYAQ